MQSNSFRRMKHASLQICKRAWIDHIEYETIVTHSSIFCRHHINQKCVWWHEQSKNIFSNFCGYVINSFPYSSVTRNWLKGIHPEVGNHITRKICEKNYYLHAVIWHMNSLIMWQQAVVLFPPVRFLQKHIYVWCNLLQFHILDPTKDGKRK